MQRQKMPAPSKKPDKPPKSELMPSAQIGVPFNANPDFPDILVNKYLKPFKIQGVFETGTYQGGSTCWFAKQVPEVHTLEINQTYFNANVERFKQFPNIKAHLGNSPDGLAYLLAHWDPKKPLCVFLDAHWHDYFPLKDEILAVARSPMKDNCFIIIDDAKCPGRPDIPYDSYKGVDISIEHLGAVIQQAIPSAVIEHYAPPPALAKSRGRILVYPKAWAAAL